MMPAADLPDDPETLKAMLLAAQGEIAHLKAVNADAETRMERLTSLLKTLERARYGRRSETLDPEQHAFVFEDIETGVAAIEATLTAASPARARSKRPRKALPPHLPCQTARNQSHADFRSPDFAIEINARLRGASEPSVSTSQ